MKWEDVEPLESKKLIDEFEKLCDYTFPKSFRKCVKRNNGGTPEKDTFDTETTEERMIGFLLSFNKDDSVPNMWDVVETYQTNIALAEKDGAWDEAEEYRNILNKYVIFADTPFGDDIAFDRTDDSIVYIDHETFEVEKIADSFDEFLDCLYDEDDDI